MRLLNTQDLRIEVFIGNRIPEYAILSHMWGKDEDEVTLQDMQSKPNNAWKRKGYMKIANCCKRAGLDGYQWCWIDTCCIDKSSSAELSEAINSMYQWYKKANVCYAYLSDVKQETQAQDLAASRWFIRGWTLQELIAPSIVEFYDADWNEIGTKLSLQVPISEITGIAQNILKGEDPKHCTVATRMSWASKRNTTREEDEAYCLMGIFNVNFGLLYGEGRRAFQRLQEEIMRVTEDYTLFLWSYTQLSEANPLSSGGLVATSPSAFTQSDLVLGESKPTDNLISIPFNRFSKTPLGINHSTIHESVPLSMTSRGLRLSVPTKVVSDDSNKKEILACLSILKGSHAGMLEPLICIKLFPFGGQDRYIRPIRETLRLIPNKTRKTFRLRTIYVEQPQVGRWSPPSWTQGENRDQLLVLSLDNSNEIENTLELIESSMPAFENPALSSAQIQNSDLGVDISKPLFLVDGTPRAKAFDFAIKGHPESRFQVVIYVHVRSPHLRAYVINPRDFQYSKATNVLELPRQEPGFRTRNLQLLAVTDRLVFYLSFVTSSRRYRISLRIRKVCSLAPLIDIPRCLLEVQHRRVSWAHEIPESDVVELLR